MQILFTNLGWAQVINLKNRLRPPEISKLIFTAQLSFKGTQ